MTLGRKLEVCERVPYRDAWVLNGINALAWTSIRRALPLFEKVVQTALYSIAAHLNCFAVCSLPVPICICERKIPLSFLPLLLSLSI